MKLGIIIDSSSYIIIYRNEFEILSFFYRKFSTMKIQYLKVEFTSFQMIRTLAAGGRVGSANATSVLSRPCQVLATSSCLFTWHTKLVWKLCQLARQLC